MNNSRLKTPLLQSAAVILVGLICFGFVVSSGTDSLFGGVWAIISGIFSLILYAIALTLGIAFCIAFLIGIFLGAVYLFSKEQAATLYNQLKTALFKVTNEGQEYANKCGIKCNIKVPTPKQQSEQPEVKVEKQDTVSKPVSTPSDDLEEKVANLEAQIVALQESEKRNSKLIKELTEKKQSA